MSFLNFPPDFKSKQILICQKQFFQCLHWLIAIQNKQMRGKFELDKSHLGHPSIRLNNIALGFSDKTNHRNVEDFGFGKLQKCFACFAQYSRFCYRKFIWYWPLWLSSGHHFLNFYDMKACLNNYIIYFYKQKTSFWIWTNYVFSENQNGSYETNLLKLECWNILFQI